MSWVKIDDQFFTHPKVLAAGKDGRALFIAALCYSAGHLTDGVVPQAALPVVAASAEVKGTAAARRLVEVGLWHEVEGGWEIHDYHDHQPRAETERAKRAEVSRARSEAGKKGAARRWADKAKPMANAKQADGKHVAPSPSPSPYPSSSPPTTPRTPPPQVAGAGAPTEEDQPRTTTDVVDAAITHMALCDEALHRADGGTIRNRTAWLRAAEANRRSEHQADLEQRAHSNHDPVALAEHLDPRCGSLDGGTARAAQDWDHTRAELTQARTDKARHQADARLADTAIATLDPDARADLEAQARHRIGDNPLANNPTVLHQTMRALVLEQENR